MPAKRATSQSPAGRGKKKSKKNEDDDSLFGKLVGLGDVDLMPLTEIAKKGGALAATVDDWIERYGENQQQATRELINFVIQVCVCRNKT